MREQPKPHPPLTEDDAWKIKRLCHAGKYDEANEFVESKGLEWLTTSPENAQHAVGSRDEGRHQ